MKSHDEDSPKNVCTCVIGHLKLKPFGSQGLDFQLAVVKSGRPKPELSRLVQSGPGNRYARHFKTSAYATYTWLTGCETLVRAFCWPCLLFSTDEANRLWTKQGHCDLNNFHNAAARHSKTGCHIGSVLALKEFEKKHDLGRGLPVSVTKQEDTGALRKEKRKILKRLISCTSLLCSQETGFSEVSVEENSKELHELLARYDDVMQRYLEGDDFLFLEEAQNDVIKCTSTVLLASIKDELEDVTCVGLVLNVHGDWLSTVVRYVTKSGEIVERLVGFTDISNDWSGGFIEKHVRTTVDSLGCVGKLVSIYRDAIVAQNCETCTDSLLVKYARDFTRDLQHVLTQSVKQIPECFLFFGALDGLSTFISRPGRNVDFLNQFVIDSLSETTTTWSSVHRQLVFVLKYRIGLLVMLNHMLSASTHHTDSDMAAALGFIIFLNDLTNCFLLVVFNDIFETTGRFLYTLQNNHKDVAFCVKEVVKIKEELISMKIQYGVRLDKAAKMAKESKRKYQMDVTRLRFYKLHDDIFENVRKLIDSRFENIQTLVFLELFDCSTFFDNCRVASNFPYDALANLKESHPLNFDVVALKSELNIAYKRDEFLKCSTVREIRNCLREYDFVESLPQLATMCTLAMTLSSTSPSQERRSRKMKRVFNFKPARNVTSKNILASMSIISIESDLLTSCLKETSRSEFCEAVISEYVAKYTSNYGR